MSGFVTTDEFEHLKVDVLRLAQVIHTMNRYRDRLSEVDTVVTAIMAPAPEVTRANESLAEIRAAAKGLGPIVAITMDWDKGMHFLTTIRGEEGYVTSEGFDLKPDSPGKKAFKEALDVLSITIEESVLRPPEDVSDGEIKRRIVYVRGPSKKEVEKPTVKP